MDAFQSPPWMVDLQSSSPPFCGLFVPPKWLLTLGANTPRSNLNGSKAWHQDEKDRTFQRRKARAQQNLANPHKNKHRQTKRRQRHNSHSPQLHYITAIIHHHQPQHPGHWHSSQSIYPPIKKSLYHQT
ncbi:hypothetical protein BJ508DRAFT_95708 [Ascobolus immersus RN42]|uniref:Uncharacterized protein n=1 Tax=Ascobolus immersus RN42 TaxID=1160509 RepID=A0A3N4IS79_ASCIM|nr:hypothetical protein BJ508DRAFT_95708 [Ascobolus immersus RN42]